MPNDGAQGGETSPRGRVLAWASTAVVPLLSGIGLAGLVSTLGAAIVWTRFDVAGLPADQAVGDLPANSLLVTGAVSLILYLVLGLLAVLGVYLLQGIVIARVLGVDENVTLTPKRLRRERKVVEAQLAGLSKIATERAAIRPTVAADSGLAARQTAALKTLEKLATMQYQLQLARAGKDPGQVRLANQWGLLMLTGAEIALVVLRTETGDFKKALLFVCVLAIVVAATMLISSYSDVEIGPEVRKMLAVAVLSAASAIFALLQFPNVWTIVPIVAAVALAGVNLAIGRLHPKRYFWYGISIFASVALFGSILTYSRTVNAPSMQPAAVLLKNGHVVTGLWIGESSSRVFLAEVTPRREHLVRGKIGVAATGKPACDAKSDKKHDASSAGRIFWIERTRVESESVGKLLRLDKALNRAEDLGCELEELSVHTHATISP